MSPVTIRVDVDTQCGFCDPKGALHVKGAERVLPNIARLNRDAAERGIPLIGSADSHDFATPEFEVNGGPWPVHCVKGTWEWLKPPELLPPRFRFIGRDPADLERASAGGEAALFFEKDAYSVFTNPNVERYLEVLKGRAGGAPLRFEVYGIATEYCVRANALDLRRRGHEVAVVLDAIGAVTEEGGRAARDEMAAAGIAFTSTAEALRAPGPAA